jgi:hypothetical protein
MPRNAAGKGYRTPADIMVRFRARSISPNADGQLITWGLNQRHEAAAKLPVTNACGMPSGVA